MKVKFELLNIKRYVHFPRSKMLSWKLNLQVVLNLHKRTKQHIVVGCRTRNPHFSQAAGVESHRGRIPKYSNVHTSLGCPLLPTEPIFCPNIEYSSTIFSSMYIVFTTLVVLPVLLQHLNQTAFVQ